MHNHDDKYPARPGFEPSTSRLQAPVDTNEPPWPAYNNRVGTTGMYSQILTHLNRYYQEFITVINSWYYAIRA